MAPPRHAYCESEVDESFFDSDKPSPLTLPLSSKTKARGPSGRGTVSTNSDSGYSSKTYSTRSTGKASTPLQPASAVHATSSNKPSTDAERSPPSTTSAGATKRTTSRPRDTKPASVASSVEIPYRNPQHAMAGPARPANAIDTAGGYYVPTSSASQPAYLSTSPTASFAPTSYHAPASIPAQRPRAASTSRSRPTSICIPAAGGTWMQDPSPSEQPPVARPPHVHAHSTPHITQKQQQYHTAQSPSAPMAGTWVRSDSLSIPPSPVIPQRTPRPPLQQSATDSLRDGRRASMYGAPVVQHHQAAYPQTPLPASNGFPDPARAAMPPPQSLPVRTSSRPPSQAVPTRTSSAQRPTVLGHQPKAKSTSFYTTGAGVHGASSMTVGRSASRAAEIKPAGNAKNKADKHTRSAQEYQERIESQASKTSQELTAEELDKRRRSKKQRSPKSEPAPKAHHRSVSQSQTRQSRAGSSVSRTGTELDRTMRLTLEGNNVDISGDTEGRNISIRPAEDGTPEVIVGSPSKRREKSYVGGSSSSRLSFADRAKRRDSAATTVDTLLER